MLQTSPLGWSSLLWVNSGKPIKLLHRTTTFPNANMLIIWSCSYILRIFPFNLSPKIIKLYSQNYRFQCFTTCLYCSISVNCVLVLLVPPSNWRSVFFCDEGIFFTIMQGSAILWNTQQIVSISFLSQKNKRKASKQAFEEGFSFSFQGSYSEQYTFHNSSLFPINTEHTLLSQEQTVSSN